MLSSEIKNEGEQMCVGAEGRLNKSAVHFSCFLSLRFL